MMCYILCRRGVQEDSLAVWITCFLIIVSGIKLNRKIALYLSAGWTTERHMIQFHTIGLFGAYSCSRFIDSTFIHDQCVQHLSLWSTTLYLRMLGRALVKLAAVHVSIIMLWNLSGGYPESIVVLCSINPIKSPLR